MIVDHFVDGASAVLVAAVIGVGSWIIHLMRQRHGTDADRDRKLDRLLQLFEGEPADPLANRPATLGVLQQIAQLRDAVYRLDVRVAELEHTVLTAEAHRE